MLEIGPHLQEIIDRLVADGTFVLVCFAAAWAIRGVQFVAAGQEADHDR